MVKQLPSRDTPRRMFGAEAGAESKCPEAQDG
jgi:hypothetical protein